MVFNLKAFFEKSKPKSKTAEIRNIIRYFDNLTDILDLKEQRKKFKSVKIEAKSVPLHLDVCEVRKGAPTLVFIPGTSSYSMCFLEFLAEVSTYGFNVIGFDPRGHGRSGGISGCYSISDLMHDAELVIDYAVEHFGDNVSLMGSSQGGIVAFYVASTNKKIKSVICQNFALLGEDDALQLLSLPMFITKPLKPLIVYLTTMFPNIKIPVLAYVNFSNDKVKYFGTIEKWLNRDPLTVKRIKTRAIHSLATNRIPRKPEEFTTPVMLLHPEDDGIFHFDYVKKIFDRIKSKKRLLIIRDGNHATLINDAPLVANYVADWMNEIHYGSKPELSYEHVFSKVV